MHYIEALLPDGRFSGQITQNRPEKNISGRKKLVAVRPPIFLKKWLKTGRKKLFHSSSGETGDISRVQTRCVLRYREMGGRLCMKCRKE
jgi:hypothetical protein